MNKLDLAYFAGLFDGEGHVTLAISSNKKCKFPPRIRLEVGLVNTHFPVIVEYQALFGGHIYLKKKRSLLYKSCWAWNVYSFQALRFLTAVFPYLHIKKFQVEIAVDFQKRHCASLYQHQNESDHALDVSQRILIMSRNGRYLKES